MALAIPILILFCLPAVWTVYQVWTLRQARPAWDAWAKRHREFMEKWCGDRGFAPDAYLKRYRHFNHE